MSGKGQRKRRNHFKKLYGNKCHVCNISAQNVGHSLLVREKGLTCRKCLPEDDPHRKRLETGKSRITKKKKTSFYESKKWRILRYKALSLHGSSCQCCGRNYKEHNVIMHVDHVKPRSKYPSLELELSNLQILCEDCNLGKLNLDETDWR